MPDGTCLACNCAIADHRDDGGCEGCGQPSCRCWVCDAFPCQCDAIYEAAVGK